MIYTITISAVSRVSPSVCVCVCGGGGGGGGGGEDLNFDSGNGFLIRLRLFHKRN